VCDRLHFSLAMRAVVVDAKHKLLHAVWAQPVDESGAATARVFHSAAKLR